MTRNRFAFAGDSAGGGIAVGTCLTARDAGLPLPAVAVTFSAGLDATRTGASLKTKEGIDPFFSRDTLRSTSGMYLAGQDPRQPLLSPAVCADMTGFPPLLLQVGTNDAPRRGVEAGELVVEGSPVVRGRWSSASPMSRASVGCILWAPARPVDLDRYALRVGSRVDQV